MILADTDVLIDFLRGKGGGADAVEQALRTGTLATTAVTRFELLSGVRGGRHERNVRALLDVLPCLPLDAAAADRAAAVRRSLEHEGRPIGMADSLIAGIALEHGGILLTRNRREFSRVAGLALG